MLAEDEAPYPVAVLGAGCEYVLRLDSFEAHAVRAVSEGISDLRMLVFAEYLVCAVHVESEQVLDPVVGVRAAAWRWAHLRDPGPDRSCGRVDRYCPSRDPVCFFKQFIARKPRRCFGVGGSPVQDPAAQDQRVDERETDRAEGPLPPLQNPLVCQRGGPFVA